MGSTIFWDIMPRNPLRVNRRFGRIYCLHLQGYFPAWLILRPWRWRRYVPPKCRLTLNGLHGVIFQKMVLLIYQPVRFFDDQDNLQMWEILTLTDWPIYWVIDWLITCCKGGLVYSVCWRLGPHCGRVIPYIAAGNGAFTLSPRCYFVTHVYSLWGLIFWRPSVSEQLPSGMWGRVFN
jgi:hypothetical protein